MQCQCTIYLNIIKITEKQQEGFEIITEINQVILFLLISLLKIIDDDGNEVDNLKYDATKFGKNETKVVIPLKHLSNFWKGLNIPLINCEAEFILTWSKNCVLDDMTVKTDINPAIVAPLELELQITDTKLFVPVVTLSKENDTFRTINNRI